MSRAADTCRSKRGMSLLELLVVLAILSVVGGLAVGQLTPLVSQARFNAGVRKIVSDLQLVRMRAIARNHRFRVTFRSDTQDYIVEESRAGVLDPAAPAQPRYGAGAGSAHPASPRGADRCGQLARGRDLCAARACRCRHDVDAWRRRGTSAPPDYHQPGRSGPHRIDRRLLPAPERPAPAPPRQQQQQTVHVTPGDPPAPHRQLDTAYRTMLCTIITGPRHMRAIRSGEYGKEASHAKQSSRAL